jgi:hypothetical protein
MYDFDALVTEVLRSKPEINRDSLMELVREKKQTVGSGYLTDQGALFLIAGELGVKLQHMITADLTLKDLHIGANDITVVARILAIYPVAEFKKKDGSGVGRYRRVNLFDRNGIGRLTIWEDNEEAIKLSGIAVDAPVRVVSAYVKQGLDGKANLNLGKRGRIETLADPSIVSKLSCRSWPHSRHCPNPWTSFKRERQSLQSTVWPSPTASVRPSSVKTTARTAPSLSSS